MKNIIYARGFPYGAPMVWIRGGGTRDQQVKDFLKEQGYWYAPEKHGWESAAYKADLLPILLKLKEMGYNVIPKEGMDPGYVIDLNVNFDDRIRAAEEAIREAGFTLRYVEYCEDAETPGLLGYYRGATNQDLKVVKVSTKVNDTPELMAEVLEHELHHVLDPTWDCGNRSVL
jgi:hypothetical protein